MAEEKPAVQPAVKPDLQHGDMPDPEAKAISCLFDQIRDLDKKYQSLKSEHEELKKRLAG
jgi:serine O-acetyltransferase